jgi:hypothetical protein
MAKRETITSWSFLSLCREFFNLIEKGWNLPAPCKGAHKRRMMTNERAREDLLRQ